MSDLLPAIPGGNDESLPADRHYEAALDTPPDPVVPEPVGELDTGARREWLPVRPHWATGDTVRYHSRRVGHVSAAHALRAPEYLLKTAFYAPVGVAKVAGRLVRWGFVTEQDKVRSEAVVKGDLLGYMRVHKDGKTTRKFRGISLLVCAFLLVIPAAVAEHLGYGWTLYAAAAVLVVLAAVYGAPADKPIVRPVTVTPRFRLINADIVLRAYYAAKLGDPDKPGQQITFGSPMAREGDGSGVDIDLPYGRGLDDAMRARPGIASGLDVQVSQVFLHRDPTSHRRHRLWVADRDPLAVPVGRTPLLANKQTDIWRAAPLGLDERGTDVKLLLMWVSVLVSALPRAGKTFVSRALALYAALDPYVKLDVFDFKGSPDWRKFKLVADSCAFGLTPTRDGNPLTIFGDTLEAIKADVQDRYHRLSEMDTRICPEGKLTREIARDPRFRMPVRLLVMDEFQEVYDLGDASKEVASLLTYLVKVAPGAGVILLASTQRPSGVGTGNVAQQFISFRDNFAVRFGLRTASWQVSDLCLGAGSYSEGLDTSTLLPEYKGVGILRGASDKSPRVRTYLADGQDAERILKAARAIREGAGTLSGMALGDVGQDHAPSIVADVLAVMGEAPAMHWQVIAPLLAARFPERHRTTTVESVSSAMRAAGVDSVQVKYLGTNLNGCRREDCMRARQREEGR